MIEYVEKCTRRTFKLTGYCIACNLNLEPFTQIENGTWPQIYQIKTANH